jgi:aconitate hydratase
MPSNPFGTRSPLSLPDGSATIYRLAALERAGLANLSSLPVSIRILLENVLRHCGNGVVTEDHVRAVAAWRPKPDQGLEVPFMPGRVVLQDFTGVPAVVDLAAMRDAMVALKSDPTRINPLVRTDLVIDHSVQVDFFGTVAAFELNVEREMERNGERYTLLRWAQKAFDNFSVVPPGTGIVHQVNLEYLASVVRLEANGGAGGRATAQPPNRLTAYPDTLVGTDSHTTMINGLGVVGWGVGGIEAEAVMLGQPYFMQLPEVVGFKLSGALAPGTTATDLVLVVTQMLRKHGVVNKFVEFFGPGLSRLGLADRATIANMSPEYGATIGFFPVDAETLKYLERTGRSRAQVELVERYWKEQGLFHTRETPDPTYSSMLELDLSSVEPSLAGPRRPQDRVLLKDMKPAFSTALPNLVPTSAKRRAVPEKDGSRWADEGGQSPKTATVASMEVAVCADVEYEGSRFDLHDGSVVIAAITSCTNTSNPSVMVGAGLVARNAVKKGLRRRTWVKTSLAPGSRVVTRYLKAANLLEDLEALGFHLVGYGCTTCIGNSGPLADPIARAITDHELVVAAVLSGNRNFEARIHPLVRANYLASPMLVVAYALAGRVDLDLLTEPLGYGFGDQPVYLKDIWPTPAEIEEAVSRAIAPEMFTQEYASVFEGTDATYVANPPYFEALPTTPPPLADVTGARLLAWFGDSVTTDHISPAGSIPKDSPAGRWLMERGVKPVDFNTFGARRGHHEVMMRGTFGNIRIKNLLVAGKEGNWTVHFPTGETISIYDAAMRYQREGTPLVVLAGAEYGTGSSRDWAAKGTVLLGVKAVIAQSYERIHRSNLIGMGVLPLQFPEGKTAAAFGFTGTEQFDLTGIARDLKPGGKVRVRARGDGGKVTEFDAVVRLDTPVEVEYYRHGGILPYVLRQLAR